MRLLAGLCSKLQHTAAVFLHLAQSHIRHCYPKKPIPSAVLLFQQPKGSEAGEHATQPWDHLIDLEMGEQELITYLNYLPADMNATSRILETELQVPQFHHLRRGEENSPIYSQQPLSDCTFGWFLWDDYYGSSNMI